MTTVALIGLGNRGFDAYGRLISEMPHLGRVTHAVDALPGRLERARRLFGLGEDALFAHWDAFFALGRVADAVVIATPDDQHLEPTLKALELGYHVLLEKPITLREADLEVLLAAERRSVGRVTVCHVLRYTPFFSKLKAMVEAGAVGQLVGIQHTENIAHWHFAHSYVRGNWRSTRFAAPMLLAKACHDLDILRWLVDSPPRRVSSQGSLHHFRPENRPVGATDRCLDGCAVEASCPYSAPRLYLTGDLAAWPTRVVCDTPERAAVLEALRSGPYGRCVYACDNDVADHQNVLVEFESGVQVALTVSAFTQHNTRTLQIFGTHGELRGDLERGEIEWHDFRTQEHHRISVPTPRGRGHAGGDERLVRAWLESLADHAELRTTLAASIDSHRMAFEAERARLGTALQGESV
ncbi:putative dehydrogenase [Deinobacterium chartae]|uniref:Putative dehydrogenase n=1 Tax=Deinobacterium chartae TaxID=521158 RepID=A0A841I050_9DEIO|nr:Gfo/Idh/MocA family oxidoreductase [Deinobacterium chartae]MBB6097502.1 putative dehydrogenase [Deinobacterium chartae]